MQSNCDQFPSIWFVGCENVPKNCRHQANFRTSCIPRWNVVWYLVITLEGCNQQAAAAAGTLAAGVGTVAAADGTLAAAADSLAVRPSVATAGQLGHWSQPPGVLWPSSSSTPLPPPPPPQQTPAAARRWCHTSSTPAPRCRAACRHCAPGSAWGTLRSRSSSRGRGLCPRSSGSGRRGRLARGSPSCSRTPGLSDRTREIWSILLLFSAEPWCDTNVQEAKVLLHIY